MRNDHSPLFCRSQKRKQFSAIAPTSMAVSSKTGGPHHSSAPDPFQFLSLRSSSSPPAFYQAGKVLPFVPPPSPPNQVQDSVACEGARRRRGFWGGGAKAEYRRLRSVSEWPDKAAPAAARQQRPRWYLCVLGSVRVPATMDMGEIRSRLERRQSVEAGKEPAGCGPSVDVGRGAWKLLRSLSCTGLESAAAVTSPSPSAAHARST